MLLNKYLEQILLSQTIEEKEKVERCLAIGLLENERINSCILKGGVNIYCIVVTSWFMMLLHKTLKFLIASISPTEVTYCDGKDTSQFSTHDYVLMNQEMLDIYAKTGFPRGALIKLTEDASYKAFTMLYIAENFIICHEIAHLLNNDFDNPDSFIQMYNDNKLMRYIEGKNHSIELKADVTGYRLISNLMKREMPEIHRNAIMLGIVSTMDVLASIEHRETYSHPSPKDRVINIAESFLPADEVKFWKDSYSKAGL